MQGAGACRRFRLVGIGLIGCGKWIEGGESMGAVVVWWYWWVQFSSISSGDWGLHSTLSLSKNKTNTPFQLNTSQVPVEASPPPQKNEPDGV